MGKSTISMAISNSYVKLPEGKMLGAKKKPWCCCLKEGSIRPSTDAEAVRTAFHPTSTAGFSGAKAVIQQAGKRWQNMAYLR